MMSISARVLLCCLFFLTGCYESGFNLHKDLEKREVSAFFPPGKFVLKSEDGRGLLTLNVTGTSVEVSQTSLTEGREVSAKIIEIASPGSQYKFHIAVTKGSRTPFNYFAFKADRKQRWIDLYQSSGPGSAGDTQNLISQMQKDVLEDRRTRYRILDAESARQEIANAEAAKLAHDAKIERRKKKQADKKAAEKAALEKRWESETPQRRRLEDRARRLAECSYHFSSYYARFSPKTASQKAARDVYLKTLLKGTGKAEKESIASLELYATFAIVSATSIYAGPKTKSPEDPLFKAAQKKVSGISLDQMANDLRARRETKMSAEDKSREDFGKVSGCMKFISDRKDLQKAFENFSRYVAERK